ncbi:MAG: hypothetical protein ACLRIS_10700 [Flavonifractor plautii]
MVYHAFGLTGSGALDIIGTQALVTLAVASCPCPGRWAPPRAALWQP